MNQKTKFLLKMGDIYDKSEELIKSDDQEKALGRVMMLGARINNQEPEAALEIAVLVHLLASKGLIK